jgi:hypothetical protein
MQHVSSGQDFSPPAASEVSGGCDAFYCGACLMGLSNYSRNASRNYRRRCGELVMPQDREKDDDRDRNAK